MSHGAPLQRAPATVLTLRIEPAPGRIGVSPRALTTLACLEQAMRRAVTRLWTWRTRRARLSHEALEQARLLVLPDASAPCAFRLVCPRAEHAQVALPGLAAPDLVVEVFGQAAVFLVRALAEPRRASLATGTCFRLPELVRALCERLTWGEALALAVPDGTCCRVEPSALSELGEFVDAGPARGRGGREPARVQPGTGGPTLLAAPELF